jgi:hypothetical protein
VPIIGPGGGSGGGAITQISSSILGASANNFDITSIPGTFNHLWLVFMARGTAAAATVGGQCIFNNDGAGNYDRQSASGNGASVSASAAQAASNVFFENLPGNTATAGMFGAVQAWIPFYAQTTAQKIIQTIMGSLPTQGTTTSYLWDSNFATWRSTAAITRVTITPASGQWAAGSGLSVYGVL